MSKTILIAFLITGAIAFPQTQLENMLSGPYAQSIKGSADGKWVAWVVNKEGVRNIWYSSVSQPSPKQLTHYEEDNGLDLGNLILTADFLIYTQGNGNNRQGYPANPASLADTPERILLRMRLSDKQTDTLASASSAVVSPDEKSLIYPSNNGVYIIPDLSVARAKPQKLFEVRSGASSLNWSPDGKAISFVSSRGDHSFIGHYQIDQQKIQWIAPSLYFDEHPAWSPDGKKIAFIRRPGQGKDELRNIMGGNPFKIMVADADGNNVRAVWDSPGDDGGFAQYYLNDPLRWTRSGKILFSSEHQGWNHLYAINPDGSGITDLSPGECEIENSALSLDENSVLISTNCGDTHRRHLWRSNLQNGQTERITSGKGIQTDPVALEGDAFAFREGLYDLPTGIVLQNGNGQYRLTQIEGDFPKDAFTEPVPIQFTAADGLTIHGQLFLADTAKKDRKPGLIFMHGGPIRQMLLGFHYSGYYANAYVMNQYLASQGYVVLAVNFRTGIGYGRDFRRAEKQGPRGASEYQDILAAARYLQSRPEVNPDKIGLWGGSYGGFLTAMGLARNSDIFKAGVDLHGVHDWSWRARDFSPGGAWGIGKDLMELALESSPVYDLSKWQSPVLLISGDDDRNVMFGQSIDLKNKLDALGIYNEALVFPDEVHGFLRHESWLKAYEASADFFNRHLKD
jgi:dipeptidyl aminopeptidase/acylaminoacyl peptidase